MKELHFHVLSSSTSPLDQVNNIDVYSAYGLWGLVNTMLCGIIKRPLQVSYLFALVAGCWQGFNIHSATKGMPGGNIVFCPKPELELLGKRFLEQVPRSGGVFLATTPTIESL